MNNMTKMILTSLAEISQALEACIHMFFLHIHLFLRCIAIYKFKPKETDGCYHSLMAVETMGVSVILYFGQSK